MRIRSNAGAPVFPLHGIRAFLFFICIVSLGSSCDSTARARQPTAYAQGVTVRAMRVVSLDPSATEIIVALGAADALIARTDYDLDSRLASLPSLGATMTSSAEAILAHRPDLLITDKRNGSRSIEQLVADAGVRVVNTDLHSIADVMAGIDALAPMVGGDAIALKRTLTHSLDSLRAAASRRGAKPTVMYVVWHDPPRVAGPNTYIQELIELAGATNAFGDLRAQWPEISLEAIVSRDPDLILLPQGTGSNASAEQLRNRNGWRSLRAVQHDNVIVVDGDLFNRPGPRVAEAGRVLASIFARADQ